MNRIEYMRRLAALLQDVPEEERVAAMQYYNDYFDDAGEENEAQVIEELGSPEKVAAEMKAGLGRQADNSGEFRETGYADTQFEDRKAPAAYGAGEQEAGDDRREPETQVAERRPWTNRWVKIILVLLIILVAAPVLIPVAIGILCCIFGLMIAVFAVFISLVIAAVAVAVSGVVLFVRGVFMGIASTPAALVIMGVGLLLVSLGVIATVASVKLCIVVLPGLFRFVVSLCRKPFHKRKAVA